MFLHIQRAICSKSLGITYVQRSTTVLTFLLTHTQLRPSRTWMPLEMPTLHCSVPPHWSTTRDHSFINLEKYLLWQASLFQRDLRYFTLTGGMFMNIPIVPSFISSFFNFISLSQFKAILEVLHHRRGRRDHFRKESYARELSWFWTKLWFHHCNRIWE